MYRIELQAGLLILMKNSQIFPLNELYFTLFLLRLVRLFGPALLFGTLEYLGLYMRNFIGPSFQENKT